MVRKKSTGIELNFDGLTDSVTNLVGALVLVVVLVIAVTKPIVSGIEKPPPPDNMVGAEQAVDPLIDAINEIDAGATAVSQDLQRVESRLPELEAEIERMRENARK